MAENHTSEKQRYRTQYIDPPEKRGSDDRRKISCFIENDRRSGIACRRMEQQRQMERQAAFRKVRFYPEYFRIV